MAKIIYYKVMAHCDYRKEPYCVGTFRTKREAEACLKKQYETPSRTFNIVAL